LDQTIFSLNKSVVDKTYDLVCAYKLNSAFYEADGLEGRKALEKIIGYIKDRHPDIAIILDAKRADTENTNTFYAKDAFGNLGVDALTINPYPGKQALQPFLDYKEKGIIIWVVASSRESEEFQQLPIGRQGTPLYIIIAQHITESWNTAGNCAVVVGITSQETSQDKLKRIKQ